MYVFLFWRKLSPFPNHKTVISTKIVLETSPLPPATKEIGAKSIFGPEMRNANVFSSKPAHSWPGFRPLIPPNSVF
jgi:hypothetical protein